MTIEESGILNADPPLQDGVDSSLDQDDYSRNPVPQEKTLSGIHIAMVVIGGTIGIPVYLMSANIGGSLGLSKAIPAFSLGCLILGLLGALTSLSGAKTHLSTYMLVEFAFGRVGARVVNFVIALSLIGWYGVTMNVFAQAMDVTILDISGQSFPFSVYIIGGSLLMCAVTVSGFKGIDTLAMLLVPFMLFFLIYAAYLSSGKITSWDMTSSAGTGISFSEAVSAVIGSYIVGVVIQPDYSRFAKNSRHALWSVFVALGLSFPVVMVLSAIPGIATGEQDLVKIMIALGIGIPAFLLLLLGSWSSNVLSLYSSALSLATIFTRVHLWQIIAAIGVIGTAIAFLDIQDYLVKFLLLLSISIPPVASIYVMETLVLRKSQCDVVKLAKESPVNYVAFLAWGSGIGMGLLAENGIFSISSIAAIDAIIVSSACYKLFARPDTALPHH
ncbi:cytosine permease [Paremcibacter congregatus]|uniref:cytosine permease n=1 Tax=Paremcibacter congregatus TaxID=2043170 RepID=UPI0030EBAECC|tara:strand:- start:4670 stop:6001 length:1332 start_codon:yes stop_codon:yes gene_type:complete